MEVRGKTVKLGFNFPQEATILRKELHEKITQQNIEATKQDTDWLEMDFKLDMNKKSNGDESDGSSS